MLFNKKQSKIIYCLFVLIILCTTLYSGIKKSPPIKGDGREYLLMTQSFINHFSADLRVEDVHSTVSDFKIQNPKFNDFWLRCDTPEQCTDSVVRFSNTPYFAAKDGRLYNYHFFLVPLLNIPSTLITKSLSLSPTTAYFLTNAVFLLLALYTLLFTMRCTLLHRLTLTLFFLAPTTFSYLLWPHPEAIVFSLVVVACCFLHNKRPLWAGAIFAIIAIQFQPFGLVAALILCSYFCSVLYQNRTSFPKYSSEQYKRVVKIGLITGVSGLLVLWPSLFYYFHFGLPNLIVMIDGFNLELLTFSRFYSLFFDFNLGAILLYPAAVLAAPLLIFTALIKLKNNQPSTTLILTYLIISVIAAIPSLITANWNHGMAHVSRYAICVAPPLVFALCQFIFTVKHKLLALCVLLFSVLLQLSSYFFHGQQRYFAERQTRTSPVALYMYRHFPTLYNPEPEIFAERLYGRENVSSVILEMGYPAFTFNGKIKKILLPSHMPFANVIQCDKKMAKTKKIKAFNQTWIYYNFTADCLPNQIIEPKQLSFFSK